MERLEWRMWVCADCPEEERPYRVVHEVPSTAVWERSCDMETCPRCGGHLSFTPYGTVDVHEGGRRASRSWGEHRI